jgi:trans-L-3-hydroxyproline dehydratase
MTHQRGEWFGVALCGRGNTGRCPNGAGLDFVTGPIEVVGCHAEGEVGDVIVGGIAVPPGDTVWDQSRWVATDGRLRSLMLNEPRGGVFRHVNLLVPATDPAADIGFIIMEPEDTPPMSGSNSMCVATVVVETGIVPMVEPVTTVTLQAPGGLVEASVECAGGKASRVTIRNVPSFAVELDATVSVEGIGELRADTAFGGDSFVMVDATDLGIELVAENARQLAELGSRITRAANEQLTFSHPTTDWDHFSFCQIAGPLSRDRDGVFTMTNAVSIEPGKLDRSPTGTGLSARMAVLRSRGLMAVGDRLRMRSVIASEFLGTIESDTTVGDRPAIVPLISGRAWQTGRFTYTVDPTDPWPLGYRVRTISNGLTIPGFSDVHRDRLRSRVSACDVRTDLTARLATGAVGPSDLMAALRSHGENRWPRYRAINGTLRMPCMHGGGLVASSSSTAGWVSDLGDGRHWLTATSAQCLSLFKPVTVDDPVDIGPLPDDRDHGRSLWWRHEALARTVMRNPERLAPRFLPERDRIEAELLASPPPGDEAFTVHSDAIGRWAATVAESGDVTDVRPWWVRRYWAKRDAAARSAELSGPVVPTR